MWAGCGSCQSVIGVQCVPCGQQVKVQGLGMHDCFLLCGQGHGAGGAVHGLSVVRCQQVWCIIHDRCVLVGAGTIIGVHAGVASHMYIIMIIAGVHGAGYLAG